MDFKDVVKKRYSCRNYSEKPVDRSIVLELLEIANMAPSACNEQNRQFVVITDEDDKKWMGEMNNQPFLAQAKVNIVVTTKLSQETVGDYLKSLVEWEMTLNGSDPTTVKVDKRMENEIKEMRYKWMVSDAAAAVENLLLAATDMGLATCWVGIMDFEGVRNRFGLPEGIVPVCVVTLGYEKEKPKYRTKRKVIAKLVHWNKW